MSVHFRALAQGVYNWRTAYYPCPDLTVQPPLPINASAKAALIERASGRARWSPDSS